MDYSAYYTHYDPYYPNGYVPPRTASCTMIPQEILFEFQRQAAAMASQEEVNTAKKMVAATTASSSTTTVIPDYVQLKRKRAAEREAEIWAMTEGCVQLSVHEAIEGLEEIEKNAGIVSCALEKDGASRKDAMSNALATCASRSRPHQVDRETPSLVVSLDSVINNEEEEKPQAPQIWMSMVGSTPAIALNAHDRVLAWMDTLAIPESIFSRWNKPSMRRDANKSVGKKKPAFIKVHKEEEETRRRISAHHAQHEMRLKQRCKRYEQERQDEAYLDSKRKRPLAAVMRCASSDNAGQENNHGEQGSAMSSSTALSAMTSTPKHATVSDASHQAKLLSNAESLLTPKMVHGAPSLTPHTAQRPCYPSKKRTHEESTTKDGISSVSNEDLENHRKRSRWMYDLSLKRKALEVSRVRQSMANLAIKRQRSTPRHSCVVFFEYGCF